MRMMILSEVSYNGYNDGYDGDGGEQDGDDIGRPGGNDYTGPGDDDGRQGDNEDDVVQDERQGDDCLTMECLLSSSPPTYMESANLTLLQLL